MNQRRILEAAEAAFGDLGPGASTAQIARRAGVGEATIFRHFATKRDLIEAVLVRHFAALESRIAFLALQRSPGAAVRQLVAEMVMGGAVKVGLISELTGGAEQLKAPAADAARRVRGALGELLGRAQSLGEIRSDIDVDAVYHLIRSLGGDARRDDSVQRLAVQVVIDGLIVVADSPPPR